MIPVYRIEVDGENVTDRFQGRLNDLTLQDMRGFKADTLTIRVSDHDDQVALPKEGATIKLALGFQGQTLTDKGGFTVQEVSHSGPPDVVEIRARSTDFRNGLMAQKSRSWDNTTLAGILDDIAKAHDLTLAITPSLSGRTIAHLDQTNESDANLVTRLGIDNDAVATVKDGRLVFVSMSEGTTSSGLFLVTAGISRQDGDNHDYQRTNSKQKYSGVKARWLNTDTGQPVYVVAGEDGECKVLKKTSATEAEAQAAAEAEWRRIKRAEVTMRLTLAVGRPELIPEQPVVLTGWKPEITSQGWIIGQVTHSLSDRGLTSTVNLEPRS